MDIKGMAAALLVIATAICAQAEPVETVTLTEPELILSDKPFYPSSALQRRLEGWVGLEFDVLADGTPASIVVADGFNLNYFASETVDWLKEQRFKPGTENGAPVLFHWSQTFAYRVRNLQSGAVSQRIAIIYNEVKGLLAQQKYAEAKAKIIAATPRCQVLADYSEMKVLLFIADMGLHLPFEALDAIRHATREKATDLAGVQLEDALRKRVILDAQLGEYKDALDTYERLRKAASLNADDVAAGIITKINAEIDSGHPIEVSGLTDSGGDWEHQLVHPFFGFAVIKDGDLRTIELRCNRAISTIKFQPDYVWGIQSAWGACSLVVRGTPGTRFVLVELSADDPLVSGAEGGKPLVQSSGAMLGKKTVVLLAIDPANDQAPVQP